MFGLGCGSGGSGNAGTVTPPVAAVTISGAADTRLGSTTQFSAVVANNTNQAVTWQVDGTTGGSITTGTISATGLYTPPTALPTPDTVTIGAISKASTSLSGTMAEAIWNPVPVMTSATVTQTTAGTTNAFLIDVQGAGFVSGTTILVGGATLSTTYISPTELQASYSTATTTTAAVGVANPNPGSSLSGTANETFAVTVATQATAARLLDQATFGPVMPDIQNVQSIGVEAYLNQQFATPATLLPDLPNTLPPACAPSNPIPCEQSEWWQTAVTAPDQLRQRVAFALSEMFVVSTNSISPYAVTPFQNLLATDAFANFSTVMKDVTLSTAMGNYLNMLNSAKPATINGVAQIANENYARENMQLFTIGINLLNPDGTPQLDSNGNMIPAYTQAQVQAFARAYTGWTYANTNGTALTKYPNGTANYDAPMASYDPQHDTGAKILLNGTTLPAGQTSLEDLNGALNNLFTHPNTGPFVCQQLIQHLVSSNPSPAYVARVAAVFADNGSGVRGDLKAVVHAVLTDTEARAGDTNPSFDGGHLREPILYTANVIRALGFTNTDPNDYWGNLSNYSGSLSEKPYGAGSVFNFFPPSYEIPGTSTLAPEFSLENTASAILRLTLANELVNNQISSFTVDLSATSSWGVLAANPANLVNALNTLFMHGQMPSNMQTAIVNHISTLTNVAERVRVAIYLIITSSQYKVMH
jgi:uncharacterized protein (DUF1800 family)